ncbi:MAG: tRNA pseudouridine(55) synthase TruB [Lautropia sp.]
MRVDGLLLLDKPAGLSSNAALQRARRLFDASRAGHGGTLDPLASGLLPVMFGEACKLAEASLAGDKGYLATVRLGVRTSTDDREGEVLEVREPLLDGRPIDRAAIDRALAAFRGPIVQVPPVFSALKVGGVPMYKRARRGETLVPEPRRVTIHSLEIDAWHSPDLVVRIRCSKGTYVRALARDLGVALGCGAHLAELRRTRVGRFDLDAAIGLDALGALDPAARDARLVTPASLVDGWPRVDLDPASAARFVHGQAVPIPAASLREAAGRPDAEPHQDPGAAVPDGATRRIAVFAAGSLIGLAANPPAPLSDSAAERASATAGSPTCLLVPSRIIAA